MEEEEEEEIKLQALIPQLKKLNHKALL